MLQTITLGNLSRFFYTAVFKEKRLVWFGLWCLMALSTIFELYRGGEYYWWRKLEYTEKTTDLSQI
jgi:hypothetical protein